jgi:hypothetical protein
MQQPFPLQLPADPPDSQPGMLFALLMNSKNLLTVHVTFCSTVHLTLRDESTYVHLQANTTTKTTWLLCESQLVQVRVAFDAC